MFTSLFSGSKTALSTLAAGSILLGSCTSSTILTTQPAGAKVYLDGQYKGVTPYQHSDTKIVGSTTDLRFEREGYAPLQVPLVRNERADAGAIVGGIFLLFPFLWTMKYDPQHTYELRPLDGNNPVLSSPASTATPVYGIAPATQQTVVKSKADRLREIKQLFDEKVLTEKEYEAEKKKILDSSDE